MAISPHFPAVLLSFAVPLAAQESPLVIKTAFEKVAENMSDGEFEVPELEDGSHYVLTLDDAGEMSAVTAPGAAPMMEIVARPVELMDLFADDVDRAQMQIQGFAAMGMAQSGIPTSEAIKFVRGIFEFPYQVDGARLVIKGDPDRPEKGYRARLTATPVKGTWFDKAMAIVQPDPLGAPGHGSSGGMLSFRAAAVVESTDPLEPILAFAAAMGSKGKDDRAKRMDVLKRMFEYGSGRMSFSWGSNGMTGLFGLNDPTAMQKLTKEPDYIDYASASVGSTDIEYVDNAFEYRGVEVARSITSMDTPMPLPFAPNGEMETWVGVAGDYMVMSGIGSGEEDMKGLIDAALTGELKSTPMPEGALFELTVQVFSFVDMMSGGMVGDGDKIPELFELHVGKSGGDLTIDVTIE